MKQLAVVVMTCLLIPGSTVLSAASPKKKCASPGAVARYIKMNSADSEFNVRRPAIRKLDEEEGNVLIFEASPELLIVSNRFDLAGHSIRFHPSLRNRYTYSYTVGSFDTHADTTVQLKDDDSFELEFRHFSFPFAKKMYDRCYINSNGNITFGAPDPDPPNSENITSGPPRIAGLFADLDPESLGAILVDQDTTSVSITWLRVPEFYSQNQFNYGENSFQIVLYHDGTFDVIFSNDITATEGFTGMFPGPGKNLRMVNFSQQVSASRPSFSFVENFHDFESIDIPQLMRAMYEQIPDRYDFVTLLSNFELIPVPGAQAFSINVRNNVSGIGNPSSDKKPIFKDNGRYGSEGRLQNITFLGNIHQYPSAPSKRIPELGASLLEVLAHEVGHRWLSYVKFQRDGQKSTRLLGRDKSHWSFFLDSDGSFLEGNQIVQKSANSFATAGPFQRYSALDLYLMGLIGPEDVPPAFVVEGASDFSPDFTFSAESWPEPDVRFRGNPVPVRIEDIIAANGFRRPSRENSQKEFRHLFVLLVKTEQPATAEEFQFSETLRAEWETFFHEATGGRAKITTNIQ